MYILKFVLRSWWRNKLFVTISLVSLVIGIACTNLLTAFVLYEYNIEYNNPNRDRILRLTQTLPFAQQEMQGTFVYHESVPEIISQFPEIEASLRTQAITHTKIRVGDQEYSELNQLSADSTLPKFIPIETLAGKIEEVLTHPGTIAISQALAERCFGTTDLPRQAAGYPSIRRKYLSYRRRLPPATAKHVAGRLAHASKKSRRNHLFDTSQRRNRPQRLSPTLRYNRTSYFIRQRVLSYPDFTGILFYHYHTR